MFGGKLAAMVVSERAANNGVNSNTNDSRSAKPIPQHIIDQCSGMTEGREPMGVNGNGAIAFGGGAVNRGG